MNTENENWTKEFDEKWPSFKGVGAMYPIFDGRPNRNHIKSFIHTLLVREMLKKLNVETVTDYVNLKLARQKEELREKIRNMRKENFGTNQYEAMYVLWKSCLMKPNELGVDDLLSPSETNE